MTQNQRKLYDGTFKAKVMLAEIASHYGVDPNQITTWKKQVLDQLPDFFSNRHSRREKDAEEEREELYRQIGQLKVELDWL